MTARQLIWHSCPAHPWIPWIDSYISWICSYLTDCSYFVKIDSSSSPSTTILTDVPQVSVLGPLPFVFFISSIANVINSDQSNQNSILSFHRNADNTQLYIGTNSSKLTSQIASIESGIQRVHDWFLNNGPHFPPHYDLFRVVLNVPAKFPPCFLKTVNSCWIDAFGGDQTLYSSAILGVLWNCPTESLTRLRSLNFVPWKLCECIETDRDRQSSLKI